MLSFGLPGLIIGPVAVSIGMVLAYYGLPLYSPDDATTRLQQVGDEAKP